MKLVHKAALAVLLCAGLASIFASYVAPAGYEQQFRNEAQAGPSLHHPLGTDDLGRDRLARLIYGMRVSLFLAPLAALLSTIFAAVVGGIAGLCGGWVERCFMAATDLFLALPWLFLLITVRALLPLNMSPMASVIITFALLGMLGWAPAARVICAGAKQVLKSDFVWAARARGCGGLKLMRMHLLPGLRPALAAQFFLSIPVFIIAEANLGALGLGVSEPLPSLGGLVNELQDFVMLPPEPWRLAPLVVLIMVIGAFQVLLNKQEVHA
ncbi:MAG TPA: ABC transporter permease [Candidatus Angelobacter sp.]|nr:ABC transporter permease [Candidatus Angelobacter sp.]